MPRVIYSLRLELDTPEPTELIAPLDRDPVDETESLTLAKARRLLSLPAGEYRDRAILAFYVYSGA